MSQARNLSVTDRQPGVDAVLSYLDTGPDEKAAGSLVFLHGLMMNKEVWSFQTHYFADKYRIIAIDLAGFGGSSRAALRKSYAEHANDIHDLLQNLRINRVHLIGWSMGASIAISFAELFLSELNSLTLVNACPKGTSSADFPWSIESGTATAMMKALESNPEFMAEKFVTQILSGSTDKALYEKILNIANSTKPEVTLHHLRLAVQSDLRAKLNNIPVPTLLINGELDVFSRTQANEYMLQQITDAAWIEIPGTGHAPFLTKTEEFNACLEQFLGNACS